jgi:hypothetical protein
MHKLHPGAVISRRNLMTTRSQPIQLPDPTGVIHLQLRRYAGCPFCSLHLRSIVQRHQETVAVLTLTFGPTLTLTVPTVALVAWARVRLGDHTPAQTLAGAALGGLVATAVFILLR